MRKKMETLASKLNRKVMYFTENPINVGDYYGYKYFIIWQNTQTVYKALKNQAECIEFLKELVEGKAIEVC